MSLERSGKRLGLGERRGGRRSRTCGETKASPISLHTPLLLAQENLRGRAQAKNVTRIDTLAIPAPAPILPPTPGSCVPASWQRLVPQAHTRRRARPHPGPPPPPPPPRGLRSSSFLPPSSSSASSFSQTPPAGSFM